MNEGTCVDQDPGFTCSCPSAYQGNCNYTALVRKLVWSGDNERFYQFPIKLLPYLLSTSKVEAF